MSDPETEDNWTISALNIHGIFFERWCQQVIADTKPWMLKSANYPVEYPPPNGPWRGKESALDLRAELKIGDSLLTLAVECKKNNPEFVNWVFFSKPPRQQPNSLTTSLIENAQRSPTTVGWDIQVALKTMVPVWPMADEGRETRGSYLTYPRTKADKTKTSNAAITDAAYQVALATQALIEEEMRFSRTLATNGPVPPMPYERQVFLPLIVTTACFFLCDFDPSAVNPRTGEIRADEVTPQSIPALFFEYPLPRHLQHLPANLAATLTQSNQNVFVRKHILVIHSEAFQSVLGELATLAPALVGNLPQPPSEKPSV